jgi:hypothetical protein
MWVYPYTDMPLKVGVDYWEIGVWLSLSDVAKSWLRLQSPVDCIPHPYYIYAKCFSTLICCGWTCGCTLTLIYASEGGVDYWEIGGMVESE